MPRKKLDLINNRLEIPSSTRVYDSLEDHSFRDRPTTQKSLVKMAPNRILSRTNALHQKCKELPGRFEYLKYDRRGRTIEIQERLQELNEKSTVSNSGFGDSRTSLSAKSSSLSPPPSFSPSRNEGSPFSGMLQQALVEESIRLKTASKDAQDRIEKELVEEEDHLAHLSEEERKKYLRRKKYEREKLEKFRQQEKYNEEHYYPTLDKLRDKLYEDTSYMIENRIKSQKLPGASWSIRERFVEDPGNPNTGPGYYDVYQPPARSTNSNILKFSNEPREKKVNVFATGDRILNSIEKINLKKDLEYFPLREKQRITRQVDQMKEKYPTLITLKTKTFKNYIPPADYEILKPHIPQISLTTSDRFDSVFNKTEPYVKTTGMTLDPDYDKKLDKRIPFQFNANTYSGDSIFQSKGNESKNVDLDVMKYYELKQVVMKSQLNYAAVFKSSAKVGLEIPSPTTAPHVGPGTFNPYKPAIEIKDPHKPSLAFSAANRHPPRPHSPDTFMRVPSFSELHTKGPIFSEVLKESAMQEGDSRNRHLATVVKEKMSQIYPKLAEKKFPSSASSTALLNRSLSTRVSTASSSDGKRTGLESPLDRAKSSRSLTRGASRVLSKSLSSLKSDN